MSRQEYLRAQIKTVEDEVHSLHKKKFELKKELLQEIHKFKINDFVTYEKPNGKLVYGRIDILNNSNQTKGGEAIVYTGKMGSHFSKEYDIIHLYDWTKERDTRLRILSSHALEGQFND